MTTKQYEDDGWSPYYCLPKAETTNSGLLQLDTTDQEVELLRRTHSIEIRQYDPIGAGPICPRPKDVPSKVGWTDRTANLSITITSHRIVLGKNRPNTNNTSSTTAAAAGVDLRFIHLSNVIAVTALGGPTFQSPFGTYKIRVSTYTYGDILLVFRGTSSNSSSNSTSTATTSTFGSVQQSKRDRDATLHELDRAVVRKQWETQQRLQQRAAQEGAVTRRRVGVDHILTKNRVRHEQAAKLASDALSGDAEQLLQEAAGLLQVIQKYTVLLERYNNTNSSNTSEGGGDIDADDESAKKLATLLSDMGMTSALTKSQVTGGGGGGGRRQRGGGGGGLLSSSSGSSSQQDYYELTARQLADFLIPRLSAAPPTNTSNKRNNNSNNSSSSSSSYGCGIITLTDAYCLFNRARGTNLISPEDLREACAILGDLRVGLSQRIFPSGVIVIQLDSMALSSDDGTTTTTSAKHRILSLCPTTALEASYQLRLSPLLALEQLEEAERLGWVCRDTTLETVKFYTNQFNDWVAAG